MPPERPRPAAIEPAAASCKSGSARCRRVRRAAGAPSSRRLVRAAAWIRRSTQHRSRPGTPHPIDRPRVEVGRARDRRRDLDDPVGSHARHRYPALLPPTRSAILRHGMEAPASVRRRLAIAVIASSGSCSAAARPPAPTGWYPDARPFHPARSDLRVVRATLRWGTLTSRRSTPAATSSLGRLPRYDLVGGRRTNASPETAAPACARS